MSRDLWDMASVTKNHADSIVTEATLYNMYIIVHTMDARGFLDGIVDGIVNNWPWIHGMF